MKARIIEAKSVWTRSFQLASVAREEGEEEGEAEESDEEAVVEVMLQRWKSRRLSCTSEDENK